MKRASCILALVLSMLITACSDEPEVNEVSEVEVTSETEGNLREVPEVEVTAETPGDLQDLFYEYEEVEVTLTAPDATRIAGASLTELGDPERGRQIFENGGQAYTEQQATNHRCARCHALDGSDGKGPSLMGISERAGKRATALSAVDYLRQSIEVHDAFIVEGFTEEMGRIHRLLLSDQEIDDLVAFLLTQ